MTEEGSSSPRGSGTRGFVYYHNDNSYYRAPDLGDGTHYPVEHILHDGQWEPYRGKDRVKPIIFGDRIDDPLADDPVGTFDALCQEIEAESPERHPIVRESEMSKGGFVKRLLPRRPRR